MERLNYVAQRIGDEALFSAAAIYPQARSDDRQRAFAHDLRAILSQLSSAQERIEELEGECAAWKRCADGRLGGAKDIAANALTRATELEAENAMLRAALALAAGRLHWAANANPGCRSDKGRALVQTFADQASAALHPEKDRP